MQPIRTLEEYRRAAEELLSMLDADDAAAALARRLEELLRYEADHGVAQAERMATRLRTPRQRPRRTAFISDIHGNHAGLLAALADIESQRCDRIVCLGDLVDGGPENEKVIETLASRRVPCVRGNHDEHNDLQLPAAARAFLEALPLTIVEDDALFVHISPRKSCRKINHVVEAWNVFEESDYRLTFIGHVHIPCIFGKRSPHHGEAAKHDFEYNRPFRFDAEDKYIVCVGSVGYGRDQVGRIRYAIFDREADTVEIRAIDGPLLPLDETLRAYGAPAGSG